jgi:hypothetical protein
MTETSPDTSLPVLHIEPELPPLVARLTGRAPFEWTESATPVSSVQCHLLDLVSDYGVWKTPGKPAPASPTAAASAQTTATPKDKVRLYCIPSIMDIVSIDPMNETFTVKFTLYLMWPVDLIGIGMGDTAQRAIDSGHYINMTAVEIDQFSDRTPLPGVSFFNAVETFDTKPADIRVYGGGELPGFTWVMWNRSIHVQLRERWELQLFPFDVQDLSINLRLNDARSWDYFDLTVCSVQFHREALTLTEFHALVPQIQREAPAHKATKVRMRVQRIANYYLQNIVLIMFLLSLLGPLAFVLDVDAVGDRLSTILTLLLTAVAFKYVISSALPKVPYNTLMDYFILLSTVSLVLTAFLCAVPKLLIPRYGATTADTVNKVLGYLCLAIAIGIPVVWLVAAQWLVRRQETCEYVRLVPKKNWYHFHFSPAPFMAFASDQKEQMTKNGAVTPGSPKTSMKKIK